jgi:adenine phosphoribosyltransferase
LNGIDKGDRVLIIDDVISTGGTMKAAIRALEQAGAIIQDIVVVIERGDGKKVIEDMGYDVQTLITVDVDQDGVKILRCIDEECQY